MNGMMMNDPGDPMLGYLAAQHDRAAAGYDKAKESQGRLTAVREQLDQLVKLGDLITQDDVVKAGGKLVAAGMGASAIAGLLADMPEGGAALQTWIAQQDQGMRQREAANAQQVALTRHGMGVAAMRLLIGHAATPQGDEVGSKSGPGPIGNSMTEAPNAD